jgi:hypothetical protein
VVRRRRLDSEWTVEVQGEVVEPVGELWRRPRDKGEPVGDRVLFPFKPYVYGASRLELRPQVTGRYPLTEESVLPKPRTRRSRRLAPAHTEWDRWEDVRAEPVSEPDPKPKPKKRKAKKKKRKPPPRRHLSLVREPTLEENLERLKQAMPGPELPPQPFVCSACDPHSPIFTATHYRCLGGDCVCYQQTPQLHDTNRKTIMGESG